MRSFAILSLASLAMAVYQPTFDEHFASEQHAKRAPFYDLSDFGYNGGMLPRVYDLTNSTLGTYLPERSYEEFQDIRAGRRNATVPHPTGISLGKRQSSIQFTLKGSNGGTSEYNGLADEDCHSGNNFPWSGITVHNVVNAYITFWESSVCNGDKGSFNPHCESESDQSCELNFEPKSFRVYDGCHDSHDNDGCR